jgi:hypothetical protein
MVKKITDSSQTENQTRTWGQAVPVCKRFRHSIAVLTLCSPRRRSGPTPTNHTTKVPPTVAAVEALESSRDEDDKHKVVLRNGDVIHGLQFFTQYQQAMAEPNIIRAKGVCGFLLHGGPRKWGKIPKSERLRAVAELVWEFKDDDWTWGYSHPIFEDMVRKIVTENNRQVNSLRLAGRTPGLHRAGLVVKLESSTVAGTGLSHDQEGDL